MVQTRRPAGSLESEVLAALWAADRPLTPGEVSEAVGGELAYTTVQTILTRLHRKGAVEREPAGRAHAYRPVIDDAGLAAQRMRAMLDRGGDHAAVLTRFVGTLTPDDEATLAKLLGDHQAGDRPASEVDH
jgi:predicted transcriptional regulator